MNVCMFTGNIGRIDDLKQGTTPYIKFSVAVNKKSKEDGNSADWVHFTAFGKTAEFISNWCSKGNKVTVLSHYSPGSYLNKDGNKVYTHDFIVDSLEKMDRAELNKPADEFVDVKADAFENDELPFM